MGQNDPIYWSHLINENWNLIVAAGDNGLCFVGSQGADVQELEDWAKRRFPGRPLIRDEARLQPFADEIEAYLLGKLTRFSIPFEATGTPFQQAVWKALCDIPYGQTASYSDIAHRIGKPSSVRAVGTAIGANPVLITIPCHRVIGKNGALAGYRGGLEMKNRLLEIEGGGGSRGCGCE